MIHREWCPNKDDLRANPGGTCPCALTPDDAAPPPGHRAEFIVGQSKPVYVPEKERWSPAEELPPFPFGDMWG